MATATATAGAVLTLTEEERAFLLKYLEQERRDTHAEARRTESPRYQEEIHHEEALLLSLVQKLQQAGSPAVK
jgi:hypothetical protein